MQNIEVSGISSPSLSKGVSIIRKNYSTILIALFGAVAMF